MEWPPQPKLLTCCDPNDLCCNVDCGNYGTCNPATGECSHCSRQAYGWADPHYIGFDGRITDFQGHCSYQLSGTCAGPFGAGNISDATPYFKLIGRQQKKAGWSNPWVTWLHGWQMEWQPVGRDGVSDIIKLKHDLLQDNSKVMIDDALSKGYIRLKSPYFYPESQILTAGWNSDIIYFGIENEEQAKDPDNNFKIKIYFTRNHYLRIHLDCEYSNQVCGLFGNMNGDRNDDWHTPEGDFIEKPYGYAHPGNQPLWKKTWEYGNSWQVSDDGLTSGATCPDNNGAEDQEFSCTEEDTELIESEAWCGKLRTAPFNTCKKDAEIAIAACVYDLCMIEKENWQDTLCQILIEHEEMCKDINQPLNAIWRTSTFCPPECEAGTGLVYNENASPASCDQTTENCQFYRVNGFTCIASTEARCACPAEKPIWDSGTEKCVDYCPTPMMNARFGDGLFYNYNGFNLRPEYAIDGVIEHSVDNADAVYNSFACSSWNAGDLVLEWHADLKTSCVVKKITIFPRRECCQSRYATMNVFYNSNIATKCQAVASWTTDYVIQHTDSGLVYNCDFNYEADKIMIKNSIDYVQLAEVRVECE